MSIDYNQVFDRVLSGQPARQPGHTGFFLPLFFLQLGPVSAPDRPGHKSTRRAELNFKTIIIIVGCTIKPNNIPTKWENKMGPHFFLNDEMSQYSCCLVGHRVDHVGSAFDDFQTLKQSWHQNVQQRSCIFK